MADNAFVAYKTCNIAWTGRCASPSKQRGTGYISKMKLFRLPSQFCRFAPLWCVGLCSSSSSICCT